MPFLTPAVATVIGAGLGTGAAIYGANKASSASKAASAAEDRSANEAIAYQKEQDTYNRQRDEEEKAYSRKRYADYLGRLDPYRSAGTAAIEGLSQRIPRDLAAFTPTNGGGMIRLASPDGEVRAVPSHLKDFYLSRGAQAVE